MYLLLRIKTDKQEKQSKMSRGYDDNDDNDEIDYFLRYFGENAAGCSNLLQLFSRVDKYIANNPNIDFYDELRKRQEEINRKKQIEKDNTNKLDSKTSVFVFTREYEVDYKGIKRPDPNSGNLENNNFENYYNYFENNTKNFRNNFNGYTLQDGFQYTLGENNNNNNYDSSNSSDISEDSENMLEDF